MKSWVTLPLRNGKVKGSIPNLDDNKLKNPNKQNQTTFDQIFLINALFQIISSLSKKNKKIAITEILRLGVSSQMGF